MSSQQLLAELQRNNDFFDQLVDMIPSKLYIAGQSGDDYNPKYFKGQSKESKEARRAQNKQAKKAKLDPSLSETTTQLKKRLEQEQHSNRGQHHQSEAHVPRVPVVPTSPFKCSETTTTASPTPSDTTVSRIEALREKLRTKLAEKRALRPTSDPQAVSKRAARRAEKKRRQEEAIQRKKRGSSNAEEKTSNKKFKLSTSLTNANDLTTDLAQVDFGRLAGLNRSSNTNYTETNKALRNLSKTKNLEKMLADAESKKQRLEELKKSSSDQDQLKAANIEWGDAIKEASGERIKDDPAKLKKALKRKATKKQKSTKAWKARLQQTQQKMDERQKVRNHNLNKRKLGGAAGANLSKKRISSTDDTDVKTSRSGGKDGRRLSRPGFEGRKQDFLNKTKNSTPNKKHQ